MSLNPVTIFNAFVAKLQQVLTLGGGAPPDTFLSFINGGYALTEDDLAFLGPNALEANLDKAYDFAQLVNAIPVAAASWVPTGESLPVQYMLFLKNGVPPQIVLTDTQQQSLREAKAITLRLYKFYAGYRTAWEMANSDYQNWLSLQNPPSDYDQQLVAKKARLDAATQDWVDKGFKNQFEANEAIVQQIEGQGYDIVFQNLRDTYTNYVSGYENDQGVNFAPVLCNPPDFYTNDLYWNTLNFDCSSIAPDAAQSAPTNTAIGATDNLFQISDGSNSGPQYPDMDNTGLQIAFEYTRVNLDRSAWFSRALLQSNCWWWYDATKSNPITQPIFSDGQPPPNTTGQWQMIPDEIIFTRNLNVTFDTTNAANQALMSSLSKATSAGFMFWRIDAPTGPQATLTSTGISVPDVQMICFLCDLMPKEPNPDPSIMN